RCCAMPALANRPKPLAAALARNSLPRSCVANRRPHWPMLAGSAWQKHCSKHWRNQTMTTDPKADPIAALEDVLRMERNALLNGDLDQIPMIVERKQQVFETLEGADRARLAGLMQLAEDNQQLVSAALKGIRAAQLRLSQIRNAASSL